MNLDLLIDNLTNPALLFFFLGVLAVQLKSDLTIPESSSRFISLYLLFSIGFKGGQELAHTEFGIELLTVVLAGIGLAILVPVYTYFILRRKFFPSNAGAIAASYGSVSAVTFVTSVAFLEMEKVEFGGYMVAVMALMEAPAIIIGVILMSRHNRQGRGQLPFGQLLKHSLTNGSVYLILGSLLIGFFANEKQAQGIEPFTTDLFKGFLSVFLLDMGMVSGRKLSAFWKKGAFPIAFAILVPTFNGLVVGLTSQFFMDSHGDRLLLSILAASASYIAVPAAMKMAAPRANPGLYIPMALGVTFPYNITLGLPLYFYVIELT
ncbi:MAG: sodium-dependent bicarbonate transport family permease [Bacteroidota bacterium]